MELVARADVEFGEHLVQVVLDGAAADEQPGADLGVGQPVAGEPRDLGLLDRQLVAGLDAALAAVSPVAASSRRARSANASAPIVVSISWAVRSGWRASLSV